MQKKQGTAKEVPWVVGRGGGDDRQGKAVAYWYCTSLYWLCRYLLPRSQKCPFMHNFFPRKGPLYRN